MNVKKSLENRIRGWLPREPTLPRRTAGNSSEKQKGQPLKNKGLRLAGAIAVALLTILTGLNYLATRQYTFATVLFAGATALIVFAYFANKYNFVLRPLRPRIGYGILFVVIGILFLVFSDVAAFFFGFIAIFTVPFATDMPVVLALSIGLLIALVFVVLVLRHEKELNLREQLTKRRLLPYGVAALLIFLTYIEIISAVDFEYAVAVTFVAMGVLVLMGLRRFTVTTTASVVLLVCMLIFGSAAGGYYTVTYVDENRYLTTAQAPDVSTINLQVRTLEGDIRVYFVNVTNPICHIDFVKQYGAVAEGTGVQFHDRSAYVDEPETTFNHTVENGAVNITAIASSVLVNITLSENYRVNLNFFTYFGGITIYSPANPQVIQSTNFTSKWGYVSYK